MKICNNRHRMGRVFTLFVFTICMIGCDRKPEMIDGVLLGGHISHIDNFQDYKMIYNNVSGVNAQGFEYITDEKKIKIQVIDNVVEGILITQDLRKENRQIYLRGLIKIFGDPIVNSSERYAMDPEFKTILVFKSRGDILYEIIAVYENINNERYGTAKRSLRTQNLVDFCYMNLDCTAIALY